MSIESTEEQSKKGNCFFSLTKSSMQSIHTLNNVSCGRPDREKNATASAPPMTLSRSASAKRNHASKRSWSAEDMFWFG